MDARDDLDDSMISWLVDARDVCFLSSKKMSAVFVSSDQGKARLFHFRSEIKDQDLEVTNVTRAWRKKNS